jgi:hypothetical protein
MDAWQKFCWDKLSPEEQAAELAAERGREEKNAKFTDDETRIIHDAALDVWNAIGYDALHAMGDAGEGHELSRATVIEIVIDCDRLRTELKRRRQLGLVERWDTLDYQAKLRLVRPAFKDSSYGL